MVTFWWCLFGLLTCGYFALAGYDYGVGMLLPAFGGDEPRRRRVLGALGPFFLANEVWLIAAVGVLFGAFPHLEERLFSGAYVLVVTLLLGLVTFTASVQLRSRRPDARRGTWTFGIVAGAALTAVSWGLFLGNLVRGLPLDAEGRPTGDLLALFHPYALVWGLGFVALFCLQGAVFLTVRGPAELTGRARRLATAFLAPVLAFLVVAIAWGAFAIDGTSRFAFIAPLIALVAFAVTAVALRFKRHRLALLGAMALSAAPAIAVGTIRLPAALVSSVDKGYALSVEAAATAPETFTVLSYAGPAAVVVLLVVQWLTWRAHRDPVDDRSLLHF
ncbi:cytochrome d ubiquinol oxidase subunit II [Amycolatopsis sp. NPDC059027]|uniref:cytochrome d ubiquinol oxidase subunit II n=1 Tax=unclassified Amycolatopsis TaxID=2618356 RepID=UPI00367206E6